MAATHGLDEQAEQLKESLDEKVIYHVKSGKFGQGLSIAQITIRSSVQLYNLILFILGTGNKSKC
jgi:hypothetical protein